MNPERIVELRRQRDDGPTVTMLYSEAEELFAAAEREAKLRAVMQLIAEWGESDGSPFALSAAKTARAALETKGDE